MIRSAASRWCPRGPRASLARVIVAAGLVALAGCVTPRAPSPTLTPVAQPCTAPAIDLRMLVIASDDDDPGLPMIRQALDQIGIPYVVWRAATQPGQLTADRLRDGCRAYFQAVLLTNGTLTYSPDGGVSWRSALSEDEWRTLSEYEATFGIRRVSWSTVPGKDSGFEAPTTVDTETAPIAAQYTDEGRAVFSYVNAREPLPIRGAVAYLAKPLDASTTPLLTDEHGNALVAVHVYPDGRECLMLTFAHGAPSLTHNLVLAYGMVSWAARGLFLGERRIYLSAQVDDVLIASSRRGGGTFRLTGDDLRAVVNWQQARQSLPSTRQWRLDLAFNGLGAVDSRFEPDTLTPVVAEVESHFNWIDHTFSHLHLGALDYAQMEDELRRNHDIALQLGLTSYSRLSLVTPEVSGLDNPEILRAARDAGVQYVVSDTSRPGEDSPSPNTGIVNRHQPAIFMIPRRPTNLFVDVSDPEEWVEAYNAVLGANLPHRMTYEEILDRESDLIVTYVLRGDINPLMFHQANLRAYDGRRSVLGNLLDRTLEKYDRLVDLPVVSPTMDEIGRQMQQRMQYDEADVSASLVPGHSVTIRAERAARVPITGLRAPGSEAYGRQYVAHLDVGARESVTLALEPSSWSARLRSSVP